MTTFTKEQLETLAASSMTEFVYDGGRFRAGIKDLAAAGLSMMGERDEAAADATILAHAYTTDSRPPQNIVDRSIQRGKDALANRWAKEPDHGDD